MHTCAHIVNFSRILYAKKRKQQILFSVWNYNLKMLRKAQNSSFWSLLILRDGGLGRNRNHNTQCYEISLDHNLKLQIDLTMGEQSETWREISVVKNICCSFRGTGFDFQHLYSSIQATITSIPNTHALFRSLSPLGTHKVHIHIYSQNKIIFFKKMGIGIIHSIHCHLNIFCCLLVGKSRYKIKPHRISCFFSFPAKAWKGT